MKTQYLGVKKIEKYLSILIIQDYLIRNSCNLYI